MNGIFDLLNFIAGMASWAAQGVILLGVILSLVKKMHKVTGPSILIASGMLTYVLFWGFISESYRYFGLWGILLALGTAGVGAPIIPLVGAFINTGFLGFVIKTLVTVGSMGIIYAYYRLGVRVTESSKNPHDKKVYIFVSIALMLNVLVIVVAYFAASLGILVMR